mmetsp:Transcript_99512/g.172740  ORF Transcript_99512/g.172740 Transcript_99512/m.172740 type:complete len:211 (+) Transcript_99512:670-1302(+)
MTSKTKLRSARSSSAAYLKAIGSRCTASHTNSGSERSSTGAYENAIHPLRSCSITCIQKLLSCLSASDAYSAVNQSFFTASRTSLASLRSSSSANLSSCPFCRAARRTTSLSLRSDGSVNRIASPSLLTASSTTLRSARTLSAACSKAKPSFITASRTISGSARISGGALMIISQFSAIFLRQAIRSDWPMPPPPKSIMVRTANSTWRAI